MKTRRKPLRNALNYKVCYFKVDNTRILQLDRRGDILIRACSRDILEEVL